MHKTLFRSFLLIIMLPLIVSCETLNPQAPTQQHNELFLPIICQNPLLKNL